MGTSQFIVRFVAGAEYNVPCSSVLCRCGVLQWLIRSLSIVARSQIRSQGAARRKLEAAERAIFQEDAQPPAGLEGTDAPQPPKVTVDRLGFCVCASPLPLG